MGGHRSRLPLAVVVAVVAAGAATLILRPRSGLIEPAAVEAEAYFSAAELDRAEDFRSLQRLLGLAGLGLSGCTLAVVALRPPAPVRRLVARAGGGPSAARPLVGAGLVLALAVVTLPLSAVAPRARRRTSACRPRTGCRGWATWPSPRRSRRCSRPAAPRWRWRSSAASRAAGGRPRRPAVTAVGVLTIYLFPVVIDPLFNNFEPLPDGKLRSDVLELADRAGVDVGEVYRVDASRRTTAANAYVGGLGHTKRVVLYDNLIEDFPPDEVESVVAHELGHVKNDDVPRGPALAGAGRARRRRSWPSGSRGGSGAGGWERPGPGGRARAGAVVRARLVRRRRSPRTCCRGRSRPAPTPSRSS